MAPGANLEEALLEDTQAAACALVVEDEFLVRWQIADILRERGFIVYEFATADDAWSYLQSGARIDVVFTDIRLPGTLNGLDLVQLIHERSVPIKAAVVTSSHLPEMATPLPVPFIRKPYDPDATAALLAKLAEVGD